VLLVAAPPNIKQVALQVHNARSHLIPNGSFVLYVDLRVAMTPMDIASMQEQFEELLANDPGFQPGVDLEEDRRLIQDWAMRTIDFLTGVLLPCREGNTIMLGLTVLIEADLTRACVLYHRACHIAHDRLGELGREITDLNNRARAFGTVYERELGNQRAGSGAGVAAADSDNSDV